MIRNLLRALSIGFLVVVPAAAIDHPIVFVRQQPVPFTFATISDIFGNFTSYEPREGQPVGGGLYRLDPDGTVTALVVGARLAVRDPEISYDGGTVWFAMKEGGRGRWQIYRIGLDGNGLELISRSARHNDWDPAPLPNGGLIFLSDRLRWADGYENLPEGQLFTMDADGRNVRQVSVNPNGLFNPLVGSNGLIYLTQWDFHDCRQNIEEDNCELDVNRFLPWEVWLDGSREGHPSLGSHTLYDFSGGYVQMREDPLRPGTFFATLADHFATFGAGTLVWLDPKRNGDRDRARAVTESVFEVGSDNTAGRFRDPYPLADGRLAAAYAAGAVYDEDGESAPDFNLVLVDRNTGSREPLLDDPDAWLLQPVEAAPRIAPRLSRGTALPGYDYAVINSRDVSLRHRNCNRVENGDCQPRVGKGEAAAVRIYRLVRRRNAYREFRRYADPRQELLGTAPVHRDGSFAAVVPPFTPIVWELVDAAGKVLVQERFWSELAPGEVRTCNGCHSKHNGRVVRRQNSALADAVNLAGVQVDRDGNGIVDLVEALGLTD